VLPLFAAFAAPLPTTTPDAVVGDGERAYVWRRGHLSTRALPSGDLLESAPAETALAGGWNVDRARVTHDGTVVAILDGDVSSAAVAGDTLWVRLGARLLRLRPGVPEEVVVADGVRDFAPLASGVAVVRERGVAMLDAGGEKVCFAPGRPEHIVASPDGHAVVLIDRQGLVVRDDHCQFRGGAPVGGHLAGFLDAERLAVIDTDGVIRVLQWPSLTTVSESDPQVDPRWRLAQGPTGPVLVNGRRVYNPQTGVFRALPLETLVLGDRGLAFDASPERIVVLDLGGSALRTVPAGLGGPAVAVAIDGDDLAVTDGFTVVYSRGGALERWSVETRIARLDLDGDTVLGATADGRTIDLETGIVSSEALRATGGDTSLDTGEPLRIDAEDRVGGRAARTTVHVDGSASTQVFDVASLAALGPPIPWSFDRTALSPDGRLLVGCQLGRLRAFSVATGRELWSVEVERGARPIVFSTFVAAESRGLFRTFHLADGTPAWVVGPVQPDATLPAAMGIAWSGGTWRADLPGPRPVWTNHPFNLPSPAVGPPVAVRTRTPIVPSPPARWAAATPGGARATARPLYPGADLSMEVGAFKIPKNGEPTILVYGPGATLPREAPDGIALVAIVTDGRGRHLRYPTLPATPAVERLLGLGTRPTAVLVGATGRALARGTYADVLAKAERAGLEEQTAHPRGALTPVWTLEAPARVEHLGVLGDGRTVVSTASGFTVLDPDGAALWGGEGRVAFTTVDGLVVQGSGRVVALNGDGATRWKRPGSHAALAGDRVILEGRSGADLATGAPREPDKLSSDPRDPGATWFPVPGGWCGRSGTCVHQNPAYAVQLGAVPARIEGRSLRFGDTCAAGFVNVLQLDTPTASTARVLAQLGNEAGPWVVVDGDHLGPLLGYGSVAAARDGFVVIARGSQVRAYRVP
jgi:outer membrane protein assembly factor BamB